MLSQFQNQEVKPQILPLQAIRKSIYAFEQLHSNTSTYHHTIAIELKGNFNIELFQIAIKKLALRHEALRSRFAELNGFPVQILENNFEIHPNWPLKIIEYIQDFSPSVQDLEKTLLEVNEHEILHKPFDIKNGPLWRCALVKLKNNHYHLLMVFHHLIIDMPSQNILIRDLSELYNSLLEEREIDLPQKPLLIDAKQPDSNNTKIEFWKKNLSDYASNSLHTEVPCLKQPKFTGDRVNFVLKPEIFNELKNIADLNHVTLHMTFLASLYILLYRYIGQTKLCIGTTSANRRNYETDINNVINCFINTVVVHLDLVGDPNFGDLLQHVKKTASDSYKNQLPLDFILEKTGTTSLFNIMFVLYTKKNTLDLKNVTTSYPIELNLNHAKFDLAISIDEYNRECVIEYDTNLFNSSYIHRLKGHLETLWEGIIKTPNSTISNLPLLTDQEKRILEAYNDTKKESHFIGFVHELFAKRAKENPDNFAVVFHKEKKTEENPAKDSITYTQLDKITNKLAAYLINIGVGPEITVGISLTRSINLIIAILAIYKAGGVVVPLETTNIPSLHYKISDTKLNILFVDNKTKDLFSEYEPGVFQLNIDEIKNIQKVIRELNLTYEKPNDLSPHNLAYIRYTSGTTQEPKGVMIYHASLTNLANALMDRKLKPHSNILSTAQATFDAIEFDILETWVTGGTLHLVNGSDNFTPEILSQIIVEEKINVATMLPHMMKLIGKKTLSKLNDLVSMGDVADKELMRDLAKEEKLILRNEWGVTESTICSTENSHLTGIGKPIRNTKMFIINPADGKNECPIGVPGEIWIAGPGLARGYVGNPELTQKKFPLKILKRDRRSFEDYEDKNDETHAEKLSPPKKRAKYTSHLVQKKFQNSNEIFQIYKTGDLGYRLENGSIDFISRINNKQMKIKGVRVELTGIETVLSTHPEIKQAIVMPYPGQIYPVAYLVTNQKRFTKKDLNTFLTQTTLPSVARLSSVICLESFPLTYHGKINTNAFPIPHFENELKISKPQTTLQMTLKKLWAEVLQVSVNSFGTNQDFIQLGGDSLAFVNLGIKINHALPLQSPINISSFSLDDTIEEMEKKLQPLLKLDTHSITLFKLNDSTKSLHQAPENNHSLTLAK